MVKYICNLYTDDILEFESTMKLNHSKIVSPEQNNNNITGSEGQVTESAIGTCI